MDPASQFKFACPVCGQHLQARAEEAGQTTECPSCFKHLIVPQAPTEAGGKLIITASLAEQRRGAVSKHSKRESQPVRLVPSKTPLFYILIAVVAVGIAVSGFFLVTHVLMGNSSESNPVRPQLWTDQVDELQLLNSPVVGRLNGRDFELTAAVWRDTKLILRGEGSDSDELRLAITFPLKGGELVAGKAFRVGLDDPPLEDAPEISWKNLQGQEERRRVLSGYVLRAEFDEISKTSIAGRVHICLLDEARSWVAGSFSAENKTRIK